MDHIPFTNKSEKSLDLEKVVDDQNRMITLLRQKLEYCSMQNAKDAKSITDLKRQVA